MRINYIAVLVGAFIFNFTEGPEGDILRIELRLLSGAILDSIEVHRTLSEQEILEMIQFELDNKPELGDFVLANPEELHRIISGKNPDPTMFVMAEKREWQVKVEYIDEHTDDKAYTCRFMNPNNPYGIEFDCFSDKILELTRADGFSIRGIREVFKKVLMDLDYYYYGFHPANARIRLCDGSMPGTCLGLGLQCENTEGAIMEQCIEMDINDRSAHENRGKFLGIARSRLPTLGRVGNRPHLWTDLFPMHGPDGMTPEFEQALGTVLGVLDAMSAPASEDLSGQASSSSGG